MVSPGTFESFSPDRKAGKAVLTDITTVLTRCENGIAFRLYRHTLGAWQGLNFGLRAVSWYWLFLGLTMAFLFRGIIPVDHSWLSAFFCAAALASAVIPFLSDKDFWRARAFILIMAASCSYMILLTANGGLSGPGAHKVLYLLAGAFPAVILGYLLGLRTDWPQLLTVSFSVLCVIAFIANLPLEDVDDGWPGGYQLVGMLAFFCVASQLLSGWRLLYCMPAIGLLVLTGHLASFMSLLIFLGVYGFTHRARALGALLGILVFGAVVGYFSAGGVMVRILYKVAPESAERIFGADENPVDLEAVFGPGVTAEEAFPSRSFLVGRALKDVPEAPLLGHGTGSHMAAYGTHPHNLFVEQLYEHGLAGVAILLLFAAVPVWAVATRFRTDRRAVFVLAYGLGVGLLSMVSGEGISRLMFFTAGLGAALMAWPGVPTREPS